jgi:phenylpyruvate tautomerase PptA (4-oxalocrotonate tautomerase family)
MPILEVTIVLKEGEVLSQGLSARIADAASAVFASSPGGTWVRLTTLDPRHYAENNGGPLHGIAPVFASVLKAEVQAPEALQDEVAKLTAAIAAATGRPADNVHIIYEPPAKGRISFGGQLRT